jgi:hypothetical protein
MKCWDIINKIYTSACVEWDVVDGKGISIDFVGGVFDHKGSGIWDSYNPDHEEAIDALIKREINLNEDDYSPHQIQRNFIIFI